MDTLAMERVQGVTDKCIMDPALLICCTPEHNKASIWSD